MNLISIAYIFVPVFISWLNIVLLTMRTEDKKQSVACDFNKYIILYIVLKRTVRFIILNSTKINTKIRKILLKYMENAKKQLFQMLLGVTYIK